MLYEVITRSLPARCRVNRDWPGRLQPGVEERSLICAQISNREIGLQRQFRLSLTAAVLVPGPGQPLAVAAITGRPGLGRGADRGPCQRAAGFRGLADLDDCAPGADRNNFV